MRNIGSVELEIAVCRNERCEYKPKPGPKNWNFDVDILIFHCLLTLRENSDIILICILEKLKFNIYIIFYHMICNNGNRRLCWNKTGIAQAKKIIPVNTHLPN